MLCNQVLELEVNARVITQFQRLIPILDNEEPIPLAGFIVKQNVLGNSALRPRTFIKMYCKRRVIIVCNLKVLGVLRNFELQCDDFINVIFDLSHKPEGSVLKLKATQWQWTYNNIRPHSAICEVPPRQLL
jgi:hypothetical protein